MALILILLLVLPLDSFAIKDDVLNKSKRQITIAILDTGVSDYSKLKICKNGLIDLTHSSITDTNGHGQNVAHAAASHLKNVNYCMYIIKYSEGNISSKYYSNEAFEKALELNVDIINFSAGGKGTSIFEWNILKKIEFKNIILVTSAGNENLNLDEECVYYPSCYKLTNIVTVGSLNNEGKRSKFSNYGKVVTISYYGENQTYGGITLTGTSQATAHITGLLARELYRTGPIK